MYGPEEKIPKYKTEIQVQFDGGDSLLGFIFVKQMQRVSDLLNDPRQFLPFQKSDGAIDAYRRITSKRRGAAGNGQDKNSSADPVFTRV